MNRDIDEGCSATVLENEFPKGDIKDENKQK